MGDIVRRCVVEEIAAVVGEKDMGDIHLDSGGEEIAVMVEEKDMGDIHLDSDGEEIAVVADERDIGDIHLDSGGEEIAAVVHAMDVGAIFPECRDGVNAPCAVSFSSRSLRRLAYSEPMSKAVEAEYLAEDQILKLAQPLDGIRDHERVRIVIEQTPAADANDWPSLSEDAGRELARAVRDAFGRDEIAV